MNTEWSYKVVNCETGESHGRFETLEAARGCVAFDHLTDWEIWDPDDQCVEYAHA